MIYLDNAATTPIYQDVIDYMSEMARIVYGNPSSTHIKGTSAKAYLEMERENIALMLSCFPEEIYFTSGATESNNIAILGCATPLDHIITTRFEHPSIMKPFEWMLRYETEVSFVAPEKDGTINLNEIESLGKYDAKLCSVMLVNNEIGTIQRSVEALKDVLPKTAVIHTDATQALGHLPVDVQALKVDLLSASAHKFGGPKGIGILYVRKGTPVSPIIFGGSQQSGLRPGTEDVVRVAGMSLALQKSYDDIENIRNLTKYLIGELKKIPNIELISEDVISIVSIITPMTGEQLVELLSNRDICVSTGSACHNYEQTPSYVLTSLGYSDEEASRAIRISIGHTNTKRDIDNFITTLKCLLDMLKEV